MIDHLTKTIIVHVCTVLCTYDSQRKGMTSDKLCNLDLYLDTMKELFRDTSKAFSAFDSNDRPDLEAANLVVDKPFADYVVD